MEIAPETIRAGEVSTTLEEMLKLYVRLVSHRRGIAQRNDLIEATRGEVTFKAVKGSG